MATARTIVTLALESMNRLAPGETLDADLAAACLRRLNAIADDWSAGRAMLPQDQLVSGSVTGASFTLGTGSFANVAAGDEITDMVADGYPMEPISMQQYNDIYLKTSTGTPQVWAVTGLSTVYLYPSAVANTITILSRKAFTQFADLDTAYTMPSGFQGAFAASLAVAMAPALLGSVPPGLEKAKREAMMNVVGATIRPSILNTNPLRPRSSGGLIFQG